MVPLRDVVQEGAIRFVHSLRPSDVAAVLDFDTEVTLRQPFKHDRTALDPSIRRQTSGDWTALYDGVNDALSRLWQQLDADQDNTPRRHAMIVISDGQDTASMASFEDMLEEAARSATLVYPIGVMQRDAPDTTKKREAVFELDRLARQTGGRAFFPRGLRPLRGAFEAIASDLANQWRKMSDLISDSPLCVDHECPECGARDHVTVERVVVGESVVTRCHCRVCDHSWHPEKSAA